MQLTSTVRFTSITLLISLKKKLLWNELKKIQITYYGKACRVVLWYSETRVKYGFLCIFVQILASSQRDIGVVSIRMYRSYKCLYRFNHYF